MPANQLTQRNCDWCGVEFTPKKPHARFHRSSCRVMSCRAKHQLTAGTKVTERKKTPQPVRPPKDKYLFNQVKVIDNCIRMEKQPKLIPSNSPAERLLYMSDKILARSDAKPFDRIATS